MNLADEIRIIEQNARRPQIIIQIAAQGFQFSGEAAIDNKDAIAIQKRLQGVQASWQR
jgi:hypothetical protein